MSKVMTWSLAGGTDDAVPTCACGCSCSCSCEIHWLRTLKGAGIASGAGSANLAVNAAGNPVGPLDPLF